MPLISLAAGLEHARENRYALGAFNVLDSHFCARCSPQQNRSAHRLSSTSPKCILSICPSIH